MIRMAIFVLAGWVSLAGAAGATAPATAPASADGALAAESLLHSALTLAHTQDAPARAARMVALAEMAARLDSSNPRLLRLLADIYEIQGRYDRAADALRRYLRLRPDDHTLGIRWLALETGRRNDADSRLAMLARVAEDESLAPPLRAEAAARQARIHDAQGDLPAMRAALVRALVLDPHHPDAIRATLAIGDEPTPADRVAAGVRILRGNPLAVQAAWELATLLDSLGLHEQAVAMFEYAWEVFLQRNEAQAASPAFVVQYLDAILDAGLPARAVERFVPLESHFLRNVDFQVLLAEALTRSGQDAADQRIIRQLAARYDAPGTDEPPPAWLAEQAWFYIVTQPDPAKALKLAEQAAQVADSPLTRRILGAAELAAGREQAGAERLEKLTGDDAYAAALLAEHYFQAGNEPAARRAIDAAAALRRGGAGWRRLAAVAAAHGVTLPPAVGEDIARLVAVGWEEQWRRMGLAPGQVLRIELIAPDEPVAAGRPLSVLATITNTSSLPAPLGQWGLLQPVLAAVVETDVPPATYDDLPQAQWPAPRYLAPGESVAWELRLDAAALGRAIAVHPLTDVTLTVRGLADPIHRNDDLVAAMPSLAAAPVTLRREGLLGEFDREDPAAWAAAYELALGRIVRDLRRGDVSARQAAARNVAALLAMVDRSFQDAEAIPEPLEEVVRRPVLLSMLRAVLQDPSPAVRAEMVAALSVVKLDEGVLRLLAGVVDDPAAVVRLRVAELLGASETIGRGTILALYVRDADELVRAMAAVFAAPAPQPEQ